MNVEVKEAWVAALRSGKYTQGSGYLHRRDRDTYCCLGVLADLAVDAAVISAPTVGPVAFVYGNDEACGLPVEVQDWAGLAQSLGGYVEIDTARRLLSTHNDVGVSFAQIADAIETQL